MPRASPPPPIDLNPRSEPALDFPERALEELAPADWAELGFLCGLEVHQQLATRGKLFCRCPAGRRTTRVDAELLRHMRPTLSEMGEYDGTALMEFKTRKEIVYLLERESACTYEMDDTPPFEIDHEAVRGALAVADAFGMNLASELEVMRKQYLDGSIPTGFQRTAMVAVGGAIPFTGSELDGYRELRIRQLTLEEDSCREVDDVGHRIRFRTDRLGEPLIETVTEPDLLTPRDVREGGRLLALVARGTGLVRRGDGAARQDVNVSIAGSRRVEIKGVNRHRILPRLVYGEAYRHLNLLRVRERLRERGVGADAFAIPDGIDAWEAELVVDATRLVGDAVPRADVDRVCAVRLPGFGGLCAHRTQPGRDFAHELAERVRVIACPTGRPFLVTSDHAGLPERVWRELRAALSADADDAIVLVWSNDEDVDTAAREVLIRAADATVGVPSETRQAHADGSTGFERILPGAERMYPDTDSPPIAIEDAWIDEVRARRPEQPWGRADRYGTLGLGEAEARRLAASDWWPLFDELAPSTPGCARRLATALELRLPHWWRERGARGELPASAQLAPLVRAVDDGRVHVDALARVLDLLLRDPGDADAIVSGFAARGDEENELERACAALAARRGELRSDDSDATLRWAMGELLPDLRGRVDPARVRERAAAALGLRTAEARA